MKGNRFLMNSPNFMRGFFSSGDLTAVDSGYAHQLNHFPSIGGSLINDARKVNRDIAVSNFDFHLAFSRLRFDYGERQEDGNPGRFQDI